MQFFCAEIGGIVPYARSVPKHSRHVGGHGMSTTVAERDYTVGGPESRSAVKRSLVSATWYRSPVPRPVLRELMQRRDGPAIRDTLIWFIALGLTGGLGFLAWGTWWAVPAFVCYGVLYGSSSDSRWHECGHRTAFGTPWMNDAIYAIASFMMLREPAIWRFSHARHHTDTLIVGRDPEIAVKRPPNLVSLVLDIFALTAGTHELRRIALHAIGRLRADERNYLPAAEYRKVFWVARLYMLILATVIAASVASNSMLPLMYVGLPTFYGGWFLRLVGLPQHAGLAEDVLDHRLNSRTIHMNPLFRFLYWNMNYHVEHHMYPLVPYHALPSLHAATKHTCPPAYRNLWEAYREMIPALIRQRRDPGYFIARELPPGAPTFGQNANGKPST